MAEDWAARVSSLVALILFCLGPLIYDELCKVNEPRYLSGPCNVCWTM